MRFSIVIPCYNAANTLKVCLQSIVDQDLQGADCEIVLVDDCSTDDSLAIAAEFDCRIIRCESKKGPGVARNLGAAAARGEILAFTDSDCIVPSGWLRRLQQHFADDTVQAVFGGYCGTAGDSPMEVFAFLDCLYRQTEMDFHIELSSSSNFACRKMAFVQVGGFPLYSLWGNDPEVKPFWGNEDMDIAYLLNEQYGDGLVWDKVNGVVHHFRSTLVTYAKQQAFFASASMVSLFKYPGLRTAHNTEGRTNAFGQLCSIAPLVGVLGIFKWPMLALMPLLSLLGVALANKGFLALLNSEQRQGYRLRFLCYLVGRNVAWTLGAVRGISWGVGSIFGTQREVVLQSTN